MSEVDRIDVDSIRECDTRVVGQKSKGFVLFYGEASRTEFFESQLGIISCLYH